MKTYNIVSQSSGKDSTATLLLALERGVENLMSVFADTGHEHPLVYEYLDYLERRLGITIRRIKPDFTDRIKNKREVVQTKWARELPVVFMADKPGRWVLKSNYARFEGAGDDGIIVRLRCPDGSEVEWPGEPTEPADVYSSTESGPFRWLPAIHGMSQDEAQQQTGVIIERALSVLHPTGNPFLDLCLWKGRFPSSRARFCTDELEKVPMFEQVFMPLLEDPDTDEVWSWQGVRADESRSRAMLKEQEEIGDGLINYRPILKWTVQDVFDMHRKHGVKWNPLYEHGMNRVGCMPCIMARKEEILEIGKRFPEEIARVAEWERLVTLASRSLGGSNLFHMDKIPGLDMQDVEVQKAYNIYDVIAWSRTGRGGKTFDLLSTMAPDVGCSSAYGLCDTPVNDNGQIIFQQRA